MKKILLIEDDRILRENTAELLELSSYVVITASNGRVGIEKAMEVSPDIIICDIMMPELDGYSVLLELSLDKSTCDIPFVFLSAKTEPKDIFKGIDMGANDHIKKPFDESTLLSTIARALAKIKEP